MPACGKETPWSGFGFTITLSGAKAIVVCLALGDWAWIGEVAISPREMAALEKEFV
jgi:hypothetical protein